MHDSLLERRQKSNAERNLGRFNGRATLNTER
jgi:hypothetical protein